MRRFFLTLSALFLTYSLFAKEGKCCTGPNWRFALSHLEPEGVGFNKGYTSLSFFGAPSNLYDWYPFVDLRGHVFNNGKWAANAGIGLRTRLSDEKIVLGLNAYYDYRETSDLDGINQVGGGLEFITSYLDFRLSGAVSTDKHFGFECEDDCIFEKRKAALPHIEAELGFPFGWSLQEVNLYFGMGTYYLYEREVRCENLGNAWGGRARLSLFVYDGIQIGGEVTYDKIFKTRGNGYITLSFPLGPTNMRKRGSRFEEKYPPPCREEALWANRLAQDVERFEIIPVQSETKECCVVHGCCH